MGECDDRIGGGCNRVVQRADAPRTGWTKTRRASFLDALAESCNVMRAAAIAGADPSGVYRLRRRDPAFAAQWRDALAIGYDRLEQMLLRRALADDEAPPWRPDGPGQAEADGPSGDRDLPAQGDAPARPGTGGPRNSAGQRGETDPVQIAMWLLNRHRAVVDGREPTHGGKRRATAEETDAALRRKLESLEKRLKAST